MTKPRLKSPRLRLFVALELPRPLLDPLVAWQKDLLTAGHGELRAGARESLHVTLAFLGHRYEKDLERIKTVMNSVDPLSVPLAFDDEAVPLPARNPRLYAAAVAAAPPLTELRRELAAVLASEAGFTDEKRDFWPHVTLCRVKSSVKRHRPLEHPPKAPPGLAGPLPAPCVTLFSSELQPAGAVYTALDRVDLPGEAF